MPACRPNDDFTCVLQTYIIKLSRSGEDGEKAHLVLESGTRFHTTQAGALATLADRARNVCPLCTCPMALILSASQSPGG